MVITIGVLTVSEAKNSIRESKSWTFLIGRFLLCSVQHSYTRVEPTQIFKARCTFLVLDLRPSAHVRGKNIYITHDYTPPKCSHR